MPINSAMSSVRPRRPRLRISAISESVAPSFLAPEANASEPLRPCRVFVPKNSLVDVCLA